MANSSGSLSNSDKTFCRLVNACISEVSAYLAAFNCNDEDYAVRQIPLLISRSEVTKELSRLNKCSPDELLRDDCQRILANPELRVADRLKVIQTLDKVLQRLTERRESIDVTAQLRAWIAEVMAGGAGPMSEL